MKWKLVYKDGKVKHEDLEDNTELPKYVLPFSIGLEKESNELFMIGYGNELISSHLSFFNNWIQLLMKRDTQSLRLYPLARIFTQKTDEELENSVNKAKLENILLNTIDNFKFQEDSNVTMEVTYNNLKDFELSSIEKLITFLELIKKNQ